MPIALPLSILAGFLSIFNPLLGCFAVMGMAVWGVFRYRKQFGEISAGIGARIGALTAFLSFIFFLVLHWLSSTIRLLPSFLGNVNRQEMIKQIHETAARNSDPRAQEIMRWFTTDQGLTVLFVAGLVLLFILFLISATATGAVTGALTKKKPQQQ